MDKLKEATEYYFRIYGVSTVSNKQTDNSEVFSARTYMCPPPYVEMESTECIQEYTEFEVVCAENPDATHYQLRWRAVDYDAADPWPSD